VGREKVACLLLQAYGRSLHRDLENGNVRAPPAESRGRDPVGSGDKAQV